MITGSSSGVGREVARTLAAEGCAVLVHGRDEGTAEETARAIRDSGGRAEVTLGDLTDPDAAERVAAAAQEVDILVNNAGPFSEHTWDDATPEHWISAFDGNVVSAVRMIQAVLPSMKAAGWGRVITLGSRAAVTPLTNMVEYSAAKAAVVNLTVGLAQHLAGTGVTANCISPGVILTPSMQQMFVDRADSDSSWSDLEQSITADYAPNPVGRLGRPRDIADAVAFLASPRADYVNGATLRVDGGITGAA